MNIHKNARLTYVRRIEMVQSITLQGQTVAQAATAHGVSEMTVRKWLGRYLAHGDAALFDKSSRPEKSPRAIEPSKALAIVELRHKFTYANDVWAAGRSSDWGRDRKSWE
jgi:transposase-like protein